MNDLGRVSVIVSVYNDAEHVAYALEGLLAQTYKNMEILVVDDGSTDHLADLVNGRFRDKVRFLIKKNGGPGSAHNWGIAASRGEFIAINDSDDVSAPCRIEKQVDFLRANPSVGFVGAQAITYTGDTVLVRNRVPLRTRQIRRDLLLRNPFVHSAIMMRKDVLVRAGMYNGSLRTMQDYDLWLRMSPLCEVANLNDVLVKRLYRENAHTRIKRRKYFYRLGLIRTRHAFKAEYFPVLAGSALFSFVLATLFLMVDVSSIIWNKWRVLVGQRKM